MKLQPMCSVNAEGNGVRVRIAIPSLVPPGEWELRVTRIIMMLGGASLRSEAFRYPVLRTAKVSVVMVADSADDSLLLAARFCNLKGVFLTGPKSSLGGTAFFRRSVSLPSWVAMSKFLRLGSTPTHCDACRTVDGVAEGLCVTLDMWICVR
jgi:hypothetical protein